MAWGRVVNLSIGSSPQVRGGGAVLESTGLDMSDLHIEFEVSRSIAFEDGEAELTIFNMNESSRAALQEGMTAVLDVGYEDSGLGTIFVGEIRQVRHSHASTDWITKLRAVAGRPVLSRLAGTTITTTYRAGAHLSKVLEDVSVGLGVTLAGIENIEGVVLPNGFYHAGRYQSLMSRLRMELAARQVGFYVDFNQMVLYKVGAAAQYSVTYLDQDSGLLSAKVLRTAAEVAMMLNAKKHKVAPTPQDIRERVKFEAVILPKIRPNSLVRLDGASVSGLYLVERAKYKGDNMGKNWTVECEASRASRTN